MQWTQYLGRRVAMTAKVVRAYADQEMAAAGASLTVAIITRILQSEPGLSQRELADRMGVEGPTMAKHMDRLETDGLVSRLRDERDRRLVRVTLTPAGDLLADRLTAVSARTHTMLTSDLSATELATLEHLLDRVHQVAASHIETDMRRNAG